MEDSNSNLHMTIGSSLSVDATRVLYIVNMRFCKACYDSYAPFGFASNGGYKLGKTAVKYIPGTHSEAMLFIVWRGQVPRLSLPLFFLVK